MASPAARIGVLALVLLSGGWMVFDGALALVVTAALGLWYLPLGTALNLGAIALALVASDRPGGGSGR